LSISLGGFPVPYLEQVIAHAVHVNNLIVCASAGNLTPFVAYPAAYTNCIAVAGSTPTDRPWRNSSWGAQVDISAPAQHVWTADFDSTKSPTLSAGNGTSFSAPLVAAAAASWLAHHGRSNLLQQYQGVSSLQEVFLQLLKTTARNPGALPAPGEYGDVAEGLPYTWNASHYGAGILDLAALLSAALPVAQPSPTPLVPTPPIQILVQLFPGTDEMQWSSFRELLDHNALTAELLQLLCENSTAREALLAFAVGRTTRLGMDPGMAHVLSIVSPTLSTWLSRHID
jgi:subtilisin family serine protease